MKTRAFVLLVFSVSTTALSGCFVEPSCPAGQVLVHDGSYGGEGVCVTRSNYSSRYDGGTSTPAAGSASSPPAAAPAVSDTTDAGGSASTGAGSCGGFTAHGDSVRVVDKNGGVPVLGDSSPNVADGSYVLVQATFYRSGTSTIPVRSLVAGLDVRGPTFAVNARDTSVAGLPEESLTFLLGSASVMTKTCESVHGSVSAWFFPFSVGGATQAQLSYDGASSFVRLIVSRSDGATELVFAR